MISKGESEVICYLHLIIEPGSIFAFYYWGSCACACLCDCLLFFYFPSAGRQTLCYVEVATSNRWQLFLKHDYDDKSIKRLRGGPSHTQSFDFINCMLACRASPRYLRSDACAFTVLGKKREMSGCVRFGSTWIPPRLLSNRDSPPHRCARLLLTQQLTCEWDRSSAHPLSCSQDHVHCLSQTRLNFEQCWWTVSPFRYKNIMAFATNGTDSFLIYCNHCTECCS